MRGNYQLFFLGVSERIKLFYKTTTHAPPMVTNISAREAHFLLQVAQPLRGSVQKD